MIGMFCFNTFADSFILLQTSDLSVSLITILIGHLLMAFVTEFGFRSYLQSILESKMNTFFASIIVGVIYSIFTANTTYGIEYAGYHFLYTFMFSMIIGELIRATHGRTIYIATIFHAAMTFALVFLFSEETGDLFLNESDCTFHYNCRRIVYHYQFDYSCHCLQNNETKFRSSATQ